ncbi:hypothetical protein [Pantoea allii]|uniref:hypothetical protein n=1 Tax=Pantoea allii TaxID=574096 RepID=UPI003D7992DE
MKKLLMAGTLLVMTQGAHAQNDNQEMQQMLSEAGVQGLCSALRQTLPETSSALRQAGPENSNEVKLSTDDRKNLVSCAYFDEQQARKGAGMEPEAFDAWSAKHTALTDYDLPDSAWLKLYNGFSLQLHHRYPDSKLTGEKG